MSRQSRQLRVEGSLLVETPCGAFQIGGLDSGPAAFFPSVGCLRHVAVQFSRNRKSFGTLGGRLAERPTQITVVLGGRPLADVHLDRSWGGLRPTPLRFLKEKGLRPAVADGGGVWVGYPLRGHWL